MVLALHLVLGLILLYFGAEWLVKGSSALALRAGVSSLVVGLTIVAFGTSAPELFVSIKAGLAGQGNIAVGNVIGSNIFNIAVILGLSAVIRPLKVNIQVLRVDTPLMVLASILLWVFLCDKNIDRFEGLFLTSGIILYTIITIHLSRKKGAVLPEHTSIPSDNKAIFQNICFIITGLAALIFGSQFFVTGAISLAKVFHISDAVIGLTIVAVGTSLPELATSVVATVKGEEDIAIGNIVGSNTFNILSVLGISSILTPVHSNGIGVIDLAVMVSSALVLLSFMRSGFRLVRIEGVFMLLIYIGYLWFLWP